MVLSAERFLYELIENAVKKDSVVVNLGADHRQPAPVPVSAQTPSNKGPPVLDNDSAASRSDDDSEEDGDDDEN